MEGAHYILFMADGCAPKKKQRAAVILVANAGNTTRKGATRATELLRGVGAPLIGTVLCNADGTGRYTYEEFYGYSRLDGITTNSRTSKILSRRRDKTTTEEPLPR